MIPANRDPSELHPHVREMLQGILTEMAARGNEVFLVEGFRSFERQNELLAQTPPATTVPGGRSWHNYGLAIDLAFRGDSPFAASHPWSTLGEVGKAAGFDEWGGDWDEFPDRPHLEWHGNFDDIAPALAILLALVPRAAPGTGDPRSGPRRARCQPTGAQRRPTRRRSVRRCASRRRGCAARR